MLFLWDCNCLSNISVLGSIYTVAKPGSLRVRKQYYDGYSYLSLGVLQALVQLTRINDIDKEYQVQRNSARTLSAVLMCNNDYYQSCTCMGYRVLHVA